MEQEYEMQRKVDQLTENMRSDGTRIMLIQARIRRMALERTRLQKEITKLKRYKEGK